MKQRIISYSCFSFSFSLISIKIEDHASGSLIFLLFNMRFHTGEFVATQGQGSDVYSPIYINYIYIL